MKAIWNNKIIAESDDTVIVEGNHYFPANSVKGGCLQPSEKTSVCPWKGTAHYYDVVANNEINKSAAWYYPEPKDAAVEIKDYVAFWKGIEIIE